MKRYLGVDLHSNNFTVCYRNEKGKTSLEQWALKDLGRFLKKLRKEDELAVESTTNTRFFCEQIGEKISKIVVVNPSQFKVISKSVKKTDDNDAETLALFLSKGMLPEVRMKDKDQNKMSSLVQTRDKLVKLRTILKNKLHNIVVASGKKLEKESLNSEFGLKQMLSMKLDAVAPVEVKVIVEQIRSLNSGIAQLEDQIKTEGSQLEGHENITSIKGIGDVSGSILLSVIGDVNDFADEGKLASYFGIVPRVHNSNNTERSGRITKQGSKLGRTTLVQCSLVAIRYSPYLRSFYDKIKNRRGTGKAIIATAKKLLKIIYDTLKNKWIFEDFTRFKIASQGNT